MSGVAEGITRVAEGITSGLFETSGPDQTPAQAVNPDPGPAGEVRDIENLAGQQDQRFSVLGIPLEGFRQALGKELEGLKDSPLAERSYIPGTAWMPSEAESAFLRSITGNMSPDANRALDLAANLQAVGETEQVAGAAFPRERWDTSDSATSDDVAASAAAFNLGAVKFNADNDWDWIEGEPRRLDASDLESADGDRRLVIVDGKAELILWDADRDQWRPDGFEVMDSHASGIATMVDIWHTYHDRHGINTWLGFGRRYAPEADDNDTGAYVNVLQGTLEVTDANLDDDANAFTMPTEGNSTDVNALRQVVVQAITQGSYESGRFFGGLPSKHGGTVADLEEGIERATIQSDRGTGNTRIFAKDFVRDFFVNVKFFERTRDSAVVQLPDADGTLKYYRWTSGSAVELEDYNPPNRRTALEDDIHGSFAWDTDRPAAAEGE